MLLLQTPFFDLHYEPTTDILRINWPDIEAPQATELGQSLEQLKATINTYFVTRVLVDGSQTTQLLKVELLLHVWRQLLDSVSDNKLKRIVRICSQNPAREALAQEVIRQIDPEVAYPNLQFAQFNTEEEAVKWLLEE